MIYARKCFHDVAIKGQLRSAPKFPRKTALTAKETEEYNLYVTETTTVIKEKNQRGEIILDQYQKGMLSKERIMQQSLMKVLASMKMEMSNKVLIAMKLKKDEQIYRFVKWLQIEVPENQVESRQDEIVNKAIEISK